MKTQRSFSKRGFTLMELMVAMAITTIIVTVLVSITSIALDTWNRSRAELRASRQAKSMIDIMAKDFESLVVRKGNNSEWLSAVSDPADLGEKMKSTNATKLVFFTAATDRYDGKIGDPAADLGGDVSCVAYQLEYKDPIDNTPTSKFKSFVLSRLLVNPDKTFTDLLGKTDSTVPAKSLEAVFDAAYPAKISEPANFVCENIFQFAVTFHVQTGSGPTLTTTPVIIGQTNGTITSQTFKIQGSGLAAETVGNSPSAADLAVGRVTAVEISATILSDSAIERIKTQTFTAAAKSKFLAQNSYEYTKVVQLPTL
jgi:prepilin-type N-terminal cleavage/methylation domain-containing protein